MKPFRWTHDKNRRLKEDRGISFEEIVLAIEADGLPDILRHHNQSRYPERQILVVALEDYVYLVPTVEEDNGLFMKTIIPSRKATRDYLARGKQHE